MNKHPGQPPSRRVLFTILALMISCCAGLIGCGAIGGSGDAGVTGAPIPIQGVFARVRLVFYNNTGASGGQAGEFEVLGGPAPSPTPPTSAGAVLPSGMVHWLQGSAGKQVTFTASRYTINGLVSGNLTLTSPVFPVSSTVKPAPDSVMVWPTRCSVSNTQLFVGGSGLQLFPSRHWGDGHYDDVRGDGNITYTCPDSRIKVNPTGLVTTNVLLTDQPTVNVTITDSSVPASANGINTTRTAVCTIVVSNK